MENSPVRGRDVPILIGVVTSGAAAVGASVAGTSSAVVAGAVVAVAQALSAMVAIIKIVRTHNILFFICILLVH
jgi:hypothetical protein